MLARCTEILGRCEVQLRSDCLFLDIAVLLSYN